jgi:hypothetical protein
VLRLKIAGHSELHGYTKCFVDGGEVIARCWKYSGGWQWYAYWKLESNGMLKSLPRVRSIRGEVYIDGPSFSGDERIL